MTDYTTKSNYTPAISSSLAPGKDIEQSTISKTVSRKRLIARVTWTLSGLPGPESSAYKQKKDVWKGRRR